MVRGRELGARLERLQSELEQAARERQEFLREQEFQHQRWDLAQGAEWGQARTWGGAAAKISLGRYQGLEQRLEAELQAAATSKEEALMALKKRALQLEEELSQVRPGLPHWCPGCRDLGHPSPHPAWGRSELCVPLSL